MNQITALSQKTHIIFTLIPLIALSSPGAETKTSDEADKPVENRPAKIETEEKDTVLEELQLSAQGIFTDSDTEESIAGDHSTDPQTAPKEADSQGKKNNTKGLPADSKKTDEYFARPSRIKKEELEKKLNKIIHQNPKNEKAYWELFELYHHYIKWSQDTEFYQENQLLRILKLLQDIHKQFGENKKVMKYLCQYFVINNLYAESRSYCGKAKKLLPDDTDLHIYADYLNETSTISNQKPENQPLNKLQALLKILKTKPPSEKLYTTIGKLFAEKKKYKLSMKYFQKAVKINDSHVPGLLGLAESLIQLNQYETALKYYALACHKHPYKSRTPFRKAKAHLSQKSLFQLASEYQEQINLCMNSIKTSQ